MTPLKDQVREFTKQTLAKIKAALGDRGNV